MGNNHSLYEQIYNFGVIIYEMCEKEQPLKEIQDILEKFDKNSEVIILNPGSIHKKIKFQGNLDLKNYTKLKMLDCSNCFIDKLLNIPETLIYLNCRNNWIDAFILPKKLRILDCSYNTFYNSDKIKLPESLEVFICVECQMVSLPELPDNLRVLDFSFNDSWDFRFDEIVYPDKLEKLKYNSYMGFNTIEFNKLPTNLKEIECSGCHINFNCDKVFPGLMKICCIGSEIYNLDVLEHLAPNLKMLDCSNNHLSSLDRLPKYLEILLCNENQLKQLDYMSEYLLYLDCSDNQLETLGNLPYGIKKIYFSGNKIEYPYDLPNSIIDGNYKYNCSNIESITKINMNYFNYEQIKKIHMSIHRIREKKESEAIIIEKKEMKEQEERTRRNMKIKKILGKIIKLNCYAFVFEGIFLWIPCKLFLQILKKSDTFTTTHNEQIESVVGSGMLCLMTSIHILLYYFFDFTSSLSIS